MIYRNTVEFAVFGRNGLFTDPITKIGGEKCTYQVPTYQALKGICESVYWKPTIIWVIDSVRVMSQIQTESKGVRPINYKKSGNDLSYYTYLRNPHYQVRAHFEWNPNRPDLSPDRNENKHHSIAKRSIALGGRRDIFLGTRECQGYVTPCSFGEGQGYYDNYGELNFRLMFHSFNYPDETGKAELSKRLWKNVVMKNGVIEFPHSLHEHPELITAFVRNMQPKKFIPGKNFNEFYDLEISETENESRMPL